MKAIPLWVKLLGGIGLLAVACVGLAFVPTGEVAYAPVAPIDLEGKISLDGEEAEPLQGRLYLVGVTERPVNLLQRLLLDLTDPSVDFGPAPQGDLGRRPRHADVQSMEQAKEVAAGVAFDLVGERVEWDGNGATVEGVEPGSPAARALRRGDIIVQVNGVGVDSSVDVLRVIRGLPPGSRVVLGVNRAGEPVRPSLRTVPPLPGDPINRSRIGVALSTISLDVVLPHEVEIDSGAVVGPSAGLAFALYLYDARSPRDLLRGRHVVVSGTLAPDGQVQAVGRMRQKALAAHEARRDLLVVPHANGEEARRAVQAACGELSSCVQVVPVRTAAEAVQLLLLDDQQLAARLSSASAAAPG